jgi:hypothetical protein
MICRDVEICGEAQAMRRAGIVEETIERKERYQTVKSKRVEKVYAKVDNQPITRGRRRECTKD